MIPVVDFVQKLRLVALAVPTLAFSKSTLLLFGAHQSSLGVHWVMTHHEKKLLNHLEGPRFMVRSLF